MNTNLEVLKLARSLYASAPSHAGPRSAVPADKYCPITALSWACERYPEHNFNEIEAFLTRITGPGLVNYNAVHSTEEVLSVFDQAIAAAAV